MNKENLKRKAEELAIYIQEIVGVSPRNYGSMVNLFIQMAEFTKQQMMKEAKLYGWVARDENGSLHLFEVEPSRIEDRGQWWDRDYNCTTLDKNDFPDLEWEDEPVYVKLIIIKED